MCCGWRPACCIGCCCCAVRRGATCGALACLHLLRRAAPHGERAHHPLDLQCLLPAGVVGGLQDKGRGPTAAARWGSNAERLPMAITHSCLHVVGRGGAALAAHRPHLRGQGANGGSVHAQVLHAVHGAGAHVQVVIWHPAAGCTIHGVERSAGCRAGQRSCSRRVIGRSLHQVIHQNGDAPGAGAGSGRREGGVAAWRASGSTTCTARWSACKMRCPAT